MTEELIEEVTNLAWDAIIAARDGDNTRAEKLMDDLEKRLREVVIPPL